MANPAPTINQINAFNATQGTTIDFNIIGGTELVRSNRIYIYDLSDNSLICTHLYVSTESIHELPPNTDGSIVYESGKSSADFVNGAQYYAQIQTFTDIAGTEGGSGLSVAKMFWCLVDPTLTITTIPSTISTTSYNISATYNANTSVVSNIIQQYQFNLYSATGSLLQSSGVVVGSGEQQGTSTAYDISYNFTGLSVGSSYYVTVEVTTTQGMSINTQSNTFTISVDTPTLGEATVVNNACDGYISVTSNLSGEYGGSGSGEIVSFDTDSENVFTKLQVDLEPLQDLNGYDAPWVGGAGKNLLHTTAETKTESGLTWTVNADGSITVTGTASAFSSLNVGRAYVGGINGKVTISQIDYATNIVWESIKIYDNSDTLLYTITSGSPNPTFTVDLANYPTADYIVVSVKRNNNVATNTTVKLQVEVGSTATAWTPYENICPISGHDEVDVSVVGNAIIVNATDYIELPYPIKPNQSYGYKMIDTTPTEASRQFNIYDENKSYIDWWTPSTNETTKTNSSGKTIKYIRFRNAYDGVRRMAFRNVSENEQYTEQTYNKEIEATYTPTVQENEPYQFKRTGDVGGDRESIELVGGSVAWNQLVKCNRGYFSNKGITAANNQDGSLTIDGTATGNTSITTDTAYTDIPINHVFYFGGYKKVGTNAGFFGVGGLSIDQENGGIWKNTTTYSSLPPRIDCRMGDSFSNVKMYPQVIDLTKLFGSTIADYIYTLEQGQAGAGVAFFRKYFPKPYYPYDAGTIKSVEGVSEHVTVGFNAWDTSTDLENKQIKSDGTLRDDASFITSDYIKVVGGSTYYFKDVAPSAQGYAIAEYDANKTFIRVQTVSGAANTNASGAKSISNDACYIRVARLKTSTEPCVNLSWDGERNGEYEPYVEHSYPLDDSLTLRGIPKVANGKLYYDGDTYESDGTVTRKYGIVDLGTLNWTASSGNKFTVSFSQAKYVPNASSALPNWICSKYQVVNYNNQPTDKYLYGVNEGMIVIKDTAYSDATTFKSAMSGVYLVYELATPTTEQADPFENIQKVTPNYGTEEFVTDSIVPVGNNTQYYTREVYGGTLDLVSGVLTVDRAITDLSTLAWSARPAWGGFRSVSIASDVKKPPTTSTLLANCKCSTYNQTTSAAIDMSTLYSYAIDTDGAVLLRMEDGKTVSDITGKLVYPLATPQTYQLTPQQIQTLVGVNNVWSEQGDVELSYHIPITNLLVKRQDVGDVSGDWLTLYSQPITQASDMDFTFIDFTNQYGKTYKYALVPLLTQTQSGVEVEVEGGYTVSDEVQSVFDGVFIVDATGSQKCKANVGYGNVDMNQTVGTITPIGAKYPVVITNSQNQYHNGSISGTIVPDDYYFNGNLSRVDMVNKRDELEQFLTNKRAKIIKDWNGKIWLVMIMDNVSCTFNNNYGMGIVNFSTNWVEVGDPTNQQDLQATGLINVGGV